MKNLTLKLAFLICIYSQAQNNTILTDINIVDVENGKILTKQNIIIQYIYQIISTSALVATHVHSQ